MTVRDDAGPTESIRRTLQVSTDPRVVRTRAAISEAVHELSRAGGELTVASVARSAGISRASFYSHYRGLDELALVLTGEAFASIAQCWFAQEHDRADAMLVSQRRLVAHFAQNRRFYRTVASMPVSKEGYLATVRAMASVIEISIAEQPLAAPVEATARYIAGAAYGLIDAWLTGEVDITDEQLVDRLVSLLPTWMSGRG